MTDLIGRLRAALDGAEQNAHRIHQWDCDGLMGVGGEYGTCDCGEPDQQRRMVAAHRKILDLLPCIRAMQEKISEEWDPGEPAGDGEAEAILAALAEYYKVAP